MDKWLTLEQMADYLKISTFSIYKIAQAEKISLYKVADSGDLKEWKLVIGWHETDLRESRND